MRRKGKTGGARVLSESEFSWGKDDYFIFIFYVILYGTFIKRELPHVYHILSIRICTLKVSTSFLGDLNKLSEGQRGYSDSTIYKKEINEEATDEVKSAGQLGQVIPFVVFQF